MNPATHNPAKTGLAMHDVANQIQQKSGMLPRRLFATPLAGSRVFIIISVENRVLAKILSLSGNHWKLRIKLSETFLRMCMLRQVYVLCPTYGTSNY